MRHSEVAQSRHGPHGVQQLVLQLDVEQELVEQEVGQLLHGLQQSSLLPQLLPNSTCAPTPR